jgi:hypothetical protein
LFLAHAVNGAVTVDPLGNVETGGIVTMHDFPGSRVLVGAAKGLFVAAPTRAGSPSASMIARHRSPQGWYPPAAFAGRAH